MTSTNASGCYGTLPFPRLVTILTTQLARLIPDLGLVTIYSIIKSKNNLGCESFSLDQSFMTLSIKTRRQRRRVWYKSDDPIKNNQPLTNVKAVFVLPSSSSLIVIIDDGSSHFTENKSTLYSSVFYFILTCHNMLNWERRPLLHRIYKHKYTSADTKMLTLSHWVPFFTTRWCAISQFLVL